MKAVFRMGGGEGKNYFPRTYQGLPTWYEIRGTRDAYAAPRRPGRIMVG